MLTINNLSAKIYRHRAAIIATETQVTDSGWFVLGPCGQEFERQFAAYLGAKHCIGVANGTDALVLGLRAIGIQKGSKVATVANAGMYTTTALLAIGAIPIFMDIDLISHTAPLAEVRRVIEKGVDAIVITHLYGRINPDINAIFELCSSLGIPLMEDCAQAHGARLNGKMAGTFGNVASFSFYPTKNLGALGDGGAVVTNEDSIAEHVYCLRQYGWKTKYEVCLAGARNSRLDELQAALLSVFLPHLDEDNSRRRSIAAQYTTGITHPLVHLPQLTDESWVVHLYVIISSERDSLKKQLTTYKIESTVHYPIPDHRQPIWEGRYANLILPHTEQLAKTALTLPCYPEMTDADVNRVIDAVNGWHQ